MPGKMVKIKDINDKAAKILGVAYTSNSTETFNKKESLMAVVKEKVKKLVAKSTAAVAATPKKKPVRPAKGLKTTVKSSIAPKK